VTVIPSGYAQINWQFTGTSCPLGADVTLGVDVSSYAGTAQDAANDARDIWVAEMLPQQVSTVTLSNTHVKFGPNATGPAADAGSSNVGGGGNPGIAPQVAALVHKTTLFGGHAGRGRMFVPGLMESDVNNAGVLDSGTLGAWQGNVDSLLSELATALLIPVVLHSAASPLSTPSTITSLDVDTKVSTQRRRLRR
jgi:hypothetical protein